MAFSAIIHRNRPDLIDWRHARTLRVRERMEQAFYIAEKEYGVTRLLDPEGTFELRTFRFSMSKLSNCF